MGKPGKVGCIAAGGPLLALAASGLQAAGGVPTPAKAWDHESQCGWWLSDDDGKSLRASIGLGDGTLLLTLADPAFLAWPEVDRPVVELIFSGEERKSVEVEGWTSHGGGDTAMLGMNLDAPARALMSGATSVEVRRGGRTFFYQALANSPMQPSLEDCVPPPSGPNSDSE